MAERTVITELVQLGVESVYGTGVPATTKLSAMSFDLSPEFEATRIRPMGYKVDSIVAPLREWATGDISGYPTYSELPWVFNSLIKSVTPSTTTGVSTWAWDWSPTSVEAVDSFTIEQGDTATRAHEVTGALITAWNATWTRTGDPEMGGTVMARQFSDGITPTAALTAAQPIPILPTHIDVFADTTYAGIGTTKLTRVMSVGLNISDMWGPLWTLNTTEASFAATIQQAPDVTLTVTVEADAAGAAFLTQMRAGTPVMWQIKGTGDTIAGGTPSTDHSMTINFVGAIDSTPTYGETDGVRTIEYTFRNVVDQTSGKALVITIINGLDGL